MKHLHIFIKFKGQVADTGHWPVYIGQRSSVFATIRGDEKA